VESSKERGWVKPLNDDLDPERMDAILVEPPAKRSWLLGGLVLSVLIVAAVVGALAWRGLRGDPLGSARSIPTGMDYVVNFDAVALSDSERLQRFVDAFATPMFEAGLIDEQPGDLVAAIDRSLGEETNFSLTGDILPWIGRSISVAGTVPEFRDPFGYAADDLEMSFLLSADVRDKEAAQAFVEKFRAFMEYDGVFVEQAVIGGLSGYRFGDTDTPFTGSIVLAGDALLVGISEDVAAGLEARETGNSMAESSSYLETMARLPADQMVTFYVSGRVLESMADLGSLGLYGGEAPGSLDASTGVTSFGGSMGLLDEGLLLTYVAFGDETAAGAIGPDLAVLKTLPAETLGFVSVAGSEIYDPVTSDRMALDNLGFVAEDFEFNFGIDIIAMLEALSGDFTVAATETRDSYIARVSDVPIGAVGALGLTDPDSLADGIDSLVDLLQQEGLAIVNDGAVSTVVGGEEELVSYSLHDDLLVIGTGRGLVGSIATGQDGGVVDSDVYRELDDAVAGDGLIVYVDIGRIVRLVPMTSDESAVLAPLRGVGVGARTDGHVAVVEALLLVDY
jgi:hypothetical protein